MRLLLVEDNKELAQTLKEDLEKYFVVELAFTGKDGEYKTYIEEYDIIILDYNLPDINGLDVCKEIRAEKIQTPILILTGEIDVRKKIESLNAGADDYLTKPFNFEELLARTRALLRRSPHSMESNIISIRDLTIDLNKKQVTRAGIPITLRKKEFHLLEYLARNAGTVISREMILDHVWQAMDAPVTNTVDVHIKYLRDHIDREYDKKLIKTIHGMGYKIEA